MCWYIVKNICNGCKTERLFSNSKKCWTKCTWIMKPTRGESLRHSWQSSCVWHQMPRVWTLTYSNVPHFNVPNFNVPRFYPILMYPICTPYSNVPHLMRPHISQTPCLVYRRKALAKRRFYETWILGKYLKIVGNVCSINHLICFCSVMPISKLPNVPVKHGGISARQNCVRNRWCQMGLNRCSVRFAEFTFPTFVRNILFLL